MERKSNGQVECICTAGSTWRNGADHSYCPRQTKANQNAFCSSAGRICDGRTEADRPEETWQVASVKTEEEIAADSWSGAGEVSHVFGAMEDITIWDLADVGESIIPVAGCWYCVAVESVCGVRLADRG